MSPDQIAAMKAVADIIGTIGAMPLSTIALLVLFGPWGILMLVSYQQNKRFEAVAKMYEANAQLVTDYQELVKGYKGIVEGQQDLIIHTTQVLTAIKHTADNNLFCPQVRKAAQGSKEPHP